VAKCHATVLEAFRNARSAEGFKFYLRFESPLDEQEVAKLLLRRGTPLRALDLSTNSLLSTNCTIFRDPEENRLICAALKKRLADCQRRYSDTGLYGVVLYVEGQQPKKLVFHVYSWMYYD
jgi:hypothetical protein